VQNVLEFIEKLPLHQQDLFRPLHSFLYDYEDVKSSIKYGIPFYTRNKMICYANPLKPNDVEIVFWNAKKMHNSLPFLDFKKRKMMGGITLNEITLENLELLDSIVQEAIEIDENDSKK
jgi:hypothetical protein